MKSKEQEVRELLAADAEIVKVAIPIPFYERLAASGRRKYGTLPKPVVVSKAMAYAAAVGLVEWESELTRKVKTAKFDALASSRSNKKAGKKASKK